MTEKQTKYNDDTLLAEYTVNPSVSVTAVIYEVTAWDMQGEPIEKEPLLDGWVKWDGCSDFDIGGDEDSYRHHYCGRLSARVVGKAVDMLYDLGRDSLDNWQGEC